MTLYTRKLGVLVYNGTGDARADYVTLVNHGSIVGPPGQSFSIETPDLHDYSDFSTFSIFFVTVTWDSTTVPAPWNAYPEACFLRIKPGTIAGKFISAWSPYRYPGEGDWYIHTDIVNDDSFTQSFPTASMDDISEGIIQGYKRISGYISLRYSEYSYQLITDVYGGEGNIDAGGWYPANSTQNINAYPAPNYQVKNWSGTLDDDSTGVSNNVLMNTNPKHAGVFFEIPPKEWTIQINIIKGNGTVSTPDVQYSLTAINPGSPSVSHTYNTDGTVTNYEWQIIIQPDSGWSLKNITGVIFIIPTTGTGTSVTFLARLSTPGGTAVVSVEFMHDPYLLKTSVASGSGDLLPETAAGGTLYPAGGVVSLEAKPANTFKVDSWTGTDNDSSTSVLNIVTMDDNKTVTVSFVEKDKYTLTASVVGNTDWGWVSPTTYTDYEDTIVTLTAGPIKGYRVKKWTGTDDDSSIHFINHATLITNRIITVEFEIGEAEDWGTTTVENNIFYCSSSLIDTNIISFSYTNNTGIGKKFHFRATFYNNDHRDTVIYSAFSFYDIKRWFLNDDGNLIPFKTDGIFIANEETVNIVYVPDFLPQELIEKQIEYKINPNNYSEKSLLCGIRYFVNIELYDSDATNTTALGSAIINQPCYNVEKNNALDNIDKYNWICSGQGKSDLRVSKTNYQSLFARVDSNLFGHFRIVWQKRESGQSIQPSGELLNQSVYASSWDSNEDRLYSSGQGLYDKLYLSQSYRPKILTDFAENFYVGGHTRDAIYVYKCSIPKKETETTAIVIPFQDFCYPGYVRSLTSQDIKIRVYQEDISNSLVVNKNKVIAVVEKRNIRFDIAGISGVYAVRMRNPDDDNWGDWINIDSAIYVNPKGDITVNQNTDRTEIDKKYDAYFIENDRFVVPWELPRVNGIRRICCQVLTFYGISRTFCIDVFVNVDISEYYVEFYIEGKLSPNYKGCAIVSEKKDSNDQPVGTRTEDNIRITDVNIRVVFNNEQKYGYGDEGDLKFNVIQQGRNDQYGFVLTPLNSSKSTNKIYTGVFQLYQDDGIFNKDGKAFISVVFPDDPMNNISCESDIEDRYNLIISQNDLLKYNNVDSEQAFNDYLSSNISRVLDINSFKQYYKEDDEKFIFGDPIIYSQLPTPKGMGLNSNV